MKRIHTVLAILLLTGSAAAFDGHRKGFVLGGGFGFAPTATWRAGNPINVEDDGSGTALNLIIGTGSDNRNLFVYEGNIAAYNSTLVDGIAQGFNGFAWYHYFDRSGPAFFTTIGVGVYVFGAKDVERNDMGWGLMVGGGYAFLAHWQIGGYFSTGHTDDPFVNLDFAHKTVTIVVSGVAF